MTANEKRNELVRYCQGMDSCEDCILDKYAGGCTPFAENITNDNKIEELYEIYLEYKGEIMEEKENRVDTAVQDTVEQVNVAEQSYDKIIEKKRDKLVKLCESYGDFCDKCPLEDSDIGICDFRKENDDLIEQYYKVAFPNEFVISITKTQAENLLEFIDIYFINSIRDDEVDNMDYLCDMCDVYKKLKDILENNK